MNFAVLTEEDYENNDQDRNKYEIIRSIFKDRVMGVFSKHITNLYMNGVQKADDMFSLTP
jgi:hypothetical protein